MGQQQLLLLVLGIVIVGLAIIIGIQTFSLSQKQFNAEGLTVTSARLGLEAQVWLRTPTTFGGGWNPGEQPHTDFTGLTLDFELMGYPVNGAGEYEDIHGRYLGAVNGADFVITAVSASTSGGGDNNLVCVTISSSSPEDISTVLNPTTGSCI